MATDPYEKHSHNNSFKNRVDPEIRTTVREVLLKHWDVKLNDLDTLISLPPIDPNDPNYFAKQAARNRAEMSAIQNIKQYAQGISGAIHPAMKNTQEEKDEAARWIAEANAKLEGKTDKLIDPKCTPKLKQLQREEEGQKPKKARKKKVDELEG